MAIRRVASVAVAVAVACCGSQVSLSSEITTRAHTRRAYQLYTHCGIKWAKIDGTLWRARHPLSDGRGNPPAGWGNPFQNGTLLFIDPRTARFDSTAGTVTFERTTRTQPPVICS